MFDLDAAFDEFASAFKGKGNIQLARALWDTQVSGPDAAACHRAIMAELKPGHLKATPEWVLRKVFGARLRITETAPVPVTTSTATPAPQPSESYTAFKNIRSMWPTDPTRVAETEASAKFAWDRSVATHGLTATVDACMYYVRKSRSLTHPVNMATWLEDDVAFYASEEEARPLDAGRSEFEAARRIYPRPVLDAEEAFELYQHRIAPEDRPAFHAAVVAYAAAKKGSEMKYIKKWDTFVSKEWLGWKSAGASALWAAIYAAAGIDEAEDLSCYREELVSCVRVTDDDQTETSCNGFVRVDFAPAGLDLLTDVVAFIEFVNANRASGYMDASGYIHHPEPISLSADEIVAEATRRLTVSAVEDEQAA